jgi:hypothetical protein
MKIIESISEAYERRQDIAPHSGNTSKKMRLAKSTGVLAAVSAVNSVSAGVVERIVGLGLGNGINALGVVGAALTLDTLLGETTPSTHERETTGLSGIANRIGSLVCGAASKLRVGVATGVGIGAEAAFAHDLGPSTVAAGLVMGVAATRMLHTAPTPPQAS